MVPERNAATQGPRSGRPTGPADRSARPTDGSERERADDTRDAARAENEGYPLGRPSQANAPSRGRSDR